MLLSLQKVKDFDEDDNIEILFTTASPSNSVYIMDLTTNQIDFSLVGNSQYRYYDFTGYNDKGQPVKTLIQNENFIKGDHTIIWNEKNNSNQFIASGLYLYRISYDNKSITEKCLIIK